MSPHGYAWRDPNPLGFSTIPFDFAPVFDRKRVGRLPPDTGTAFPSKYLYPHYFRHRVWVMARRPDAFLFLRALLRGLLRYDFDSWDVVPLPAES